jgi:hypothetical protein
MRRRAPARAPSPPPPGPAERVYTVTYRPHSIAWPIEVDAAPRLVGFPCGYATPATAASALLRTVLRDERGDLVWGDDPAATHRILRAFARDLLIAEIRGDTTKLLWRGTGPDVWAWYTMYRLTLPAPGSRSRYFP